MVGATRPTPANERLFGMDQSDRIDVCEPGGKATATGGISQTRLKDLLDDPEALLWQYIDHPVKIDHGGLMVRAELALTQGSVAVALKRYRPRSSWKAFCSLFRPSAARRDWNRAHGLLARQIPTAQPLAIVEPSPFRPERRSYLATQWIESAENLHLFGWRLADCPMPQRLSRAAACAESLGHLIGKMHGQGISHRDLKPANLLVVQTPEPLRGGSSGCPCSWPTTTYLVDMGGVRVARWPTRTITAASRARDLARLAAGIEAHPWVSHAIRLRFLRAYERELADDRQLPGPPSWKALWRDVAARSRRIVARKSRRGRAVL